MLRSWAMAEVTNPRWAPNLVGVQWPPALKAKMDAGEWASLTEAEWEFVEHVIRQLRAPLLDGLLALQPEWYEDELPIGTVAEIRTMTHAIKKAPLDDSQTFRRLSAERRRASGSSFALPWWARPSL